MRREFPMSVGKSSHLEADAYRLGHFARGALSAGLCAALVACAARPARVGETTPAVASSSSAAMAATHPADNAPTASPVCYDCFWSYQPEGFREELARWYEAHPQTDPLADADRRYLLARVEKDPRALCDARRAFDALRRSVADPERRLLVEETLAFTARECGEDVTTAFGRASGAAELADQPFKARLYHDLALGRFQPVFGEVEIPPPPAAPAGATGFVLGESRIHVTPEERIGVQVERTVRDWLSYQLSWDLSRRPPTHDEMIAWHEGARLREVMESVPVRIVP